MLKKIVAFFKDWDNQSTYIKWIAGYTKPYIPSLLLIMGFDAIESIISVAMALVSKQMIDNAIGGESIFSALVTYLVIIVVSQILNVVSSLISVVVFEKFSFGIRKQVFEKVLNTRWLDVSKYHTGDLMTRLTSDAGVVADGIANQLPSILRLIFEFIITFCTLAYYEWRLALFAVVVGPFAAIISWWLGKKIGKVQKKIQQSESTYRSFIQESFSNILIVKTFNAEEYSAERLANYRDERFKWIYKKNKISLAASSCLALCFQLAYITAFAWGAFSIKNGWITYGTMTVFLTLINKVQVPIIGLAQTIPKIASVLTSASRIIEIQDLPIEERIESDTEFEQVGLRIEEVSFGYSDDIVLSNVNMDIKPGQFVAICGESGIGKTTLVRLIMSFAKHSEGKMEFYNNNFQTELSNAASRRFISYVPQGNTLFSGTIAENVRMGRLDASREEIIQSLKDACAYDFVSEFPNGIDTVIGEKGVGISEGQSQRIAIARALIRNAPFLILDEATSSLDEETELKVLESFSRVSPRPTCLLITHRKSVLKYCDREIKISHGNVTDHEIKSVNN